VIRVTLTDTETGRQADSTDKNTQKKTDDDADACTGTDTEGGTERRRRRQTDRQTASCLALVIVVVFVVDGPAVHNCRETLAHYGRGHSKNACAHGSNLSVVGHLSVSRKGVGRPLDDATVCTRQ
jgi:hypothetical protein